MLFWQPGSVVERHDFKFLRAEVIRLGTDALLLPSILLGTDTACFLVSLNETV